MAKSRKTKQEKIISDLRKKLATNAVAPASPSSSSSLYTFTQNKVNNPKPQHTSSTTRSIDSKYVLSDLKKTFILSTIAILAQVVLYFVLVR